MTCMNRLRDAHIKDRIYCYFDDIFIDLDSKVDKSSYKRILIYYVGYEASNTVTPFCIIFNKKKFFDRNNGSKYLELLSNDENRN